MVVVRICVRRVESSRSYTSSCYGIGLFEVSSAMLLQVRSSGIDTWPLLNS